MKGKEEGERGEEKGGREEMEGQERERAEQGSSREACWHGTRGLHITGLCGSFWNVSHCGGGRASP